MTPEENLRDLREDNKRLSRLLARLRERDLRERNMTPAEIAELRWLELDYEDEKNGDWTR